MAVFPQRRWSIKSPLGVRIQRGHPVAQDIGPVYLFNEATFVPSDLSGKSTVGFAATSLSWSLGRGGPALLFDGTASRLQSSATLPIPTDRYSMFALVRSDIADAAYRDIARWCGDSAFLLQNSSNTWAFAPTGAEYGDTTTPLVVGEWAMLVGTYDSAGRTRLYKNGRLYTDTASNASPPAAGTLTIGSITNGGSQQFNGVIEMLGFANRVMTGNDAAALAANPYCFMQPQTMPRGDWIVPAAGGTVNSPAFMVMGCGA